MPTYEYGCSECGHEWEEIQRITAPPLEVCPKCGKTSAHRLISAGTGFILKGGGWYSDLYSSANGAKKKAAEETSKPAGESGSEKPSTESSTKKTESPATKPEASSSSSTSTASSTS
jgi:putative FmdB family regulatory protein